MIVLDATTRKLQLVLVKAKTTNDCPYSIQYIDLTTTAFTPGQSNGVTNGTGAVDAVAAPAGSTQREIKEILLQNADTSVVQVKVRYNDNGTTYDIYNGTLQAGQQLIYTDIGGWRTEDTGGQEMQNNGTGAGRYLKTTLINRPTVAFITTALTNLLYCRMVGGGGAGGGAATAASSGGAGGGGSAGGYAEALFFVQPNTSYVCACGTGGTPGAAGSNPGGNGGSTTFAAPTALNGALVTVTANGGLGGTGMAATTTILTSLGGASAVISTNGTVNGGSQPGDIGFQMTGLVGCSGKGGNSFVGGGGNARNTQGAGVDATGIGSGGGGGLNLNAGGAVAGGSGQAGFILADEYT